MKRILMSQLGEVGDVVKPSSDEHRHLVSVRRIQIGEELEILDSRGGLAVAEVVEASKRDLRLKITSRPQMERESEPHLWLALAIPAQLSTFDTMLPGLVQLGVQEIFLCPTEWSGRLKKDPERYMSRLVGIMTQSLKQCGRLITPGLEFVASWKEVCDIMDQECDTKVIYHPGHSNHLTINQPKRIGLAFGAEAGFTRKEVDFATARGFQVKNLGPRILKMETAVIGACFWARESLG